MYANLSRMSLPENYVDISADELEYDGAGRAGDIVADCIVTIIGVAALIAGIAW